MTDNKVIKDSFLKKNKGIFILLGLVFIVYFATRGCNVNDESIIRRELSGIIKKIGQRRGLTSFTLTYEYTVRSHPNINFKPISFSNFARVGDSLYKYPNSDSIYIIREGRKYGWHIPLKDE
jgi:hypothetical protein